MQRARAITLGFGAQTALYLYAFPSATIPYLALTLGHVTAGFVLAVLLLLTRPRSAGWIVASAGAVLGIALMWTGASRPFAGLLYAHIGDSARWPGPPSGAWFRGVFCCSAGAGRFRMGYPGSPLA